jgi:hypothetical protein
MTDSDREYAAWVARCEFGNLGNRTTCTCPHCAAWRVNYERQQAALADAQRQYQRTATALRRRRKRGAP